MKRETFMRYFLHSRRPDTSRAQTTRTRVRLAAGVALAAALSLGLAAPALAQLPGDGSVSPTAATGIPQLGTSGRDGSVERVRQLVQCSDKIYAVGLFTSIKRNSTVYNRTNAFSFDAATGAMTSWAPTVNGQVDTVALSADCSTAYLGGTFTAIGSTAVKNLAAVSTGTGAVIPGFASSAGGKVNTLAMVKNGSRLLVGGNFTSINGSTKDYLVSLDPTTGKDDGYVSLNISGKYVYTDDGGQQSKGNATQVFNTEVSPDGSKLLAMGVFTSVGGAARRQIFMLDLGAGSATVNAWYSKDFDQNCHVVEPFYLQAAAWAPDMSKVYVATTGYKAANGIGYRTSDPRGDLSAPYTNICDAAAAYPSIPTTVRHDWINYTGCDSLYSTAADNGAVYAGGHQRWADSPVQCDGNGNGTKVVSPGLSGIDPVTGAVIRSSTDPSVGKYSRGRGLGADDMLLTGAGLWIASDNAQNSNSCGKTGTGKPAFGHAGICFLPY